MAMLKFGKNLLATPAEAKVWERRDKWTLALGLIAIICLIASMCSGGAIPIFLGAGPAVAYAVYLAVIVVAIEPHRWIIRERGTITALEYAHTLSDNPVTLVELDGGRRLLTFGSVGSDVLQAGPMIIAESRLGSDGLRRVMIVPVDKTKPD